MKFPTRPFILLAVISGLAILVASQIVTPYQIQIARGDNPYLRDFWDPEADSQGNTFRWTKGKSEVIFHNAGQIFPPSVPVTLELRLASARPSDLDLPDVHLTLRGEEEQDLGVVRVPSTLTTQRFPIDSARAGNGDWTLEITSETFKPAGDSRELGISLRRATLRPDDTGQLHVPRFPTSLYATLIPLFLFLCASEILSFTRIRSSTQPLSIAIAVGVILALASGLALYPEQTILYLPFLFLLSCLLGGWAFSRILRSSKVPMMLSNPIVYRWASWTGLALLVLGEALIWLTDQTTLGAILLITGATSTFVSMLLRPLSPKRTEIGALSARGWILLGCIFLLALVMRVYRLDEVLFGLFRDETRMGLLGMRVLNDPNYRPIYEGPPISQSGLLIYLLALDFRTIGAGIFSLRLVGALAGAMTVPLVWRLARDWFPTSLPSFGAVTRAPKPKEKSPILECVGGAVSCRGSFVALVAAFGLAVGTMHVYYSRFTLPYVESPLLSIPAYIFLGRALEGGKWRNYALAGFFFGATQYASQVSRVSLLVGAFLVLDEIVARRALPRNFVRGALILSVAALIITAPLLGYIAQHPNAFLARTGQVSLFNDKTSAGDYPTALLWNNIVAYAGMFNVVGDSHGGHVVPTRPEFDPVFGLLFIIGFLYGVTRLREAPFRRVLFWLFASLLPGLLSIEAPAPLRVLEAPAPTYILAGVGAVWLLGQTANLSRVNLGQVTAVSYKLVAITLPVVALVVFTNAHVYFGELGDDPRLWDKNQAISTPIGATLNEWLEQYQIPSNAVVYAPDWLLSAADDRDVLNFTTNNQLKFTPLSQAPDALPSSALIIRPNIVGYWKTIIAWQPDTNIPARWTEEDAKTRLLIQSMSGSRGTEELRGPNFPGSEETTFWLYVAQ